MKNEMTTEFLSKVVIYKVAWPSLTVTEEGKSRRILFNPRSVNNIIFDPSEKSISIMMTNSRVYKILCGMDYGTLAKLIEEYFTYK